MSTFIKILMFLTGGRPMTVIGDGFTDIVSGERVKIYRDYYGREWMASAGKWSRFRVKR